MKYGLKIKPFEEVCAFSGATEGIAAFLLGYLNPGDEVILFAPLRQLSSHRRRGGCNYKDIFPATAGV